VSEPAVGGPPSGPRPTTFVDVTDELWPVLLAWCQAATVGDDSWFHEHLAEEFVHIMGGGEVEPKDRTIAMTGMVRNRSFVLQELLAHRYGDVTLVRGVYSARGDIPPGGAPPVQIARYATGARVRFSMLWVPNVDGRLVCAQFQSTTIEEPT